MPEGGKRSRKGKRKHSGVLGGSEMTLRVGVNFLGQNLQKEGGGGRPFEGSAGHLRRTPGGKARK